MNTLNSGHSRFNVRSLTNVFNARLRSRKPISWSGDESNLKPKGDFKVKLRITLTKISGAFMLPISLMAIGGMLLGVGASIATQSPAGSAGQTFGNFIKNLGEPIFAALPLLFAVAFVIAFTQEAGVGVFATIVAYLVFLSIQSVFISGDKTQGYTVLFEGLGRNKADLKNLVGDTLGVKSLQTSVFGGLIVGFIMSIIYNRYHTIQLPQYIAVFAGKRFVAIMGIFVMIPLAFLFLLFWPWVGIGLNKFGTETGKVPYGFESFIFGYLERSLVPFGLQHAFYAPLWYTSAGGDMKAAFDDAQVQCCSCGCTNGSTGGDNGTTEFIKAFQSSTTSSSTPAATNGTTYRTEDFIGDSTMSSKILGLPFNTIDESKVKIGSTQGSGHTPILQWLEKINIRIGRYLQGKYVFMQYGLPAAAAAMVLAAPKENRKVALSAVVPAAGTCVITGVTEPIEFTFLFLSPFLFWGFHSFMAALAFQLMNVLGAHIGQAFSGGILDLIPYGIIPYAKGTKFWLLPILGVGYAPIYFFFFLWWIKYKNLQTPGRGEAVKLYTRTDWRAKQDAKDDLQTLSPEKAVGQLNAPKSTKKSELEYAISIIEACGGYDNILKINNCASRVRIDFVNGKVVNQDALKAVGAYGVRWVGDHHGQVIFGPRAEAVAANMRNAMKAANKPI